MASSVIVGFLSLQWGCNCLRIVPPPERFNPVRPRIRGVR